MKKEGKKSLKDIIRVCVPNDTGVMHYKCDERNEPLLEKAILLPLH